MSTQKRSEVEIRIAQEIVNHQDLMRRISDKIILLQDGVKTLTVSHVKDVAACSSDIQALRIEFENLKEELLKKSAETSQRIGDVETKLLKYVDAIDRFTEQSNDKFLTSEEFRQQIDNLSERVNGLHVQIIKKTNSMNATVENIKDQLRSEVRDVENRLSPRIQDITPITKELEDKFKTMRTDFVGLIREITYLKKTSYYDQKKFEYFYTQISRIKGEKV